MVNKITTPPTTSELIDKVNELVDDKQDIIDDLATIRSGAALGATALQPSALNGYATQAWVGEQGYITGITSSDVTTALGYTPYNSTNPNGYITSSALTPYALSEDLASVATSGSYNDLSDKPTIPTVNNPTITFTQGGTTKGTITLNQSSDQTVAFDAGGSARNIGEIIQSTIPLTDAGLHLLDGSVIHGGGVYGDFYNYIAGIVNTYPNLFVTEGTWQAEVASHGVCGKFVFYEPNRTVRLPKITGFIEGTTDVTALGDLLQAGLPNITGETSIVGGGSSGFWVTSAGNSALFGTQQQTSGFFQNTGSESVYHAISIDASRSSSIYGNSSTVQPQSIKVLYYICIATSIKTDIEVDIDEIVTDLNQKVDKNSLAPVHCVVETYVNGTSWYRVYDDGWCEQGGRINIASMQYGSTSVSLLKPFNDTNYTITIGGRNLTLNGNPCFAVGNSVTTNSFNIWMERTTGSNHDNQSYWQACGYIS